MHVAKSIHITGFGASRFDNTLREIVLTRGEAPPSREAIVDAPFQIQKLVSSESIQRISLDSKPFHRAGHPPSEPRTSPGRRPGLRSCKRHRVCRPKTPNHPTSLEVEISFHLKTSTVENGPIGYWRLAVQTGSCLFIAMLSMIA